MLTLVDYAVIAIYFVAVTLFGIKAAGRQSSQSDYFLGGKDLPWWAICFSIVATETSTLTVIGVPAISFGGTLTFLQIAFGYLIGRILVSVIFLPRYYSDSLITAYSFLGKRFGPKSQACASITFLVTRLLADGVRLFATAIPIKVMLQMAGFDISYFAVIFVIGILTMLYTSVGGLKAVVWMDFIQMNVYLMGAVIAIGVLLFNIDSNWSELPGAAGKLQFVDIKLGRSIHEILTSPYVFITSILGGAIFTMASHGTDHLIVQRLLACKNLNESKKALISSGFLIIIQFGLFLSLGVLLWGYYSGMTVTELGLSRADEVYPKFIIEGLPPGVSGFILAGIIAAAMSTLSSSLNALASSSINDIYSLFKWKEMSEEGKMKMARFFTVLWGVVFIFFASLFENQQNPVVELGLAIATFTYGGLLGVFVLGLVNKHINDQGASVALVLTVFIMTFVILGVKYAEGIGWLFNLNDVPDNIDEGISVKTIAWPLYTLIGASITLLLGWVFSRLAYFRERNR